MKRTFVHLLTVSTLIMIPVYAFAAGSTPISSTSESAKVMPVVLHPKRDVVTPQRPIYRPNVDKLVILRPIYKPATDKLVIGNLTYLRKV